MRTNTFDQLPQPVVSSLSRLSSVQSGPVVARRRSVVAHPIEEAFDALTHLELSQNSSANRPAARVAKTSNVLLVEKTGVELRPLDASPQYKPDPEQGLPSLNPATIHKLVRQHRATEEAKTWANQLDGAIQGTSLGEFVRSQFKHKPLSLDEAQQFGAMVKQILQDKSAPNTAKQLGTVPLLRALAQVTHGDLDLALEVLVRLGRPLDIGMHGPASGKAQINEYAWRCAQQLAYERGPALEALLKLQEIDPAQATLSKATRLTVYLQAAYKLRTLEPALSARAEALDFEVEARGGIKARLKAKPEAQQALAALKVARLAALTAKSFPEKPLNLAALEENKALKTEEIAAYWTWGQGFEENQPDSLLARSVSRLLKAGKAWVTRGQVRAVLQHKIDQAPNWSLARLLARAELFMDDMPRAFNQKKTPYRPTEHGFDDVLKGIYGETIRTLHSQLCSYGEKLLEGKRNAEGRAETESIVAKLKQRIEWSEPAQNEAVYALAHERLSLDELKEIAKSFLAAGASEARDGWQLHAGVITTLLKQAEQQAGVLNLKPLHEINPKTLQAFQLSYINQNNGSRFEECDGGRVGLGLSVALKTHGVASVSLFARRTYGAEVAHAMSLSDAGLQLEFGKRQRKTIAVRGGAFFGARCKLGVAKIIFGSGATVGMNYQTGEAEHATLHALKSSGTQGADGAWRDTAEKMVKNYWNAIDAAQSHAENEQQAFLNALARANFDDPNILLGNRNKSNMQVDLFITGSLGVYFALNPQSDSPASIGLAAEVTAKATPYSAGREALANGVVQGHQKRAGQAAAILVDTSGRLLPGVSIPVETEAIKEVGPSGLLARLRRIHAKLNTKKIVAERGRHGMLHVMHNPQGIEPKFTFIDETFANGSHFKKMLDQDSRWNHLYAAKLNNFIDSTPNEKETKLLFGVRWQLKDEPDLMHRMNAYTHEITQLRRVEQQITNKAEKRTIKERIEELQSRVDGLFADPASWKPYGLFKAREAKQGSSDGWKYIGWATHEHERTSVSDVEWLLPSA
ncbi:hypothetical protein [Mycoavidus sp. B2-EB]|uniref:hypothetical protein n=1 Tax=Mycoavidus sp. B2-EB TaxID=2651972 RepID=UPI0016270841|nr:hypothetical protein [Mycoavidus sp. B2-EB]BBO59436.1 hypothetical protein MPB2EB_0554 [Mycoavidus sp. B2-EB]